MLKYEAVIFDLDGTLLNTLDDLRDSVNYALDRCGYAQRGLDEIRDFVGNGTKQLLLLSLPPKTPDTEFERCFGIFKEHYAQNSRNKTAPYPGITELLRQVKEAGIKTAVVSNKPDFQTNLLCEEYFGGLYGIAVGARDGVRLKPAPDSVLDSLERLGVPADRAIYVGDSDVDAKTAHNSNLPFAGVTWGFRSREVLEANNADYIAENPRELAEIIV